MHRLLFTLFLNVLSILLFSQTNDIDRLLKLGIKSHVEGKNKIAIQYYDSVLAKNPNDTIALYNKGIACLNANKKKDAEDCFQKVLMINPNHYNSLNEISKMYEKPEAIPLFCLMKMNIIYYKSNLSKENYQKIQDIFHKFINGNDTSLKAVSNIPRFRNAIKKWYNIEHNNRKIEFTDNNFEFVDVSIVASGSFDYKKEFGNLNEAELMYLKLIPLCKMMKKYRLFNHGFYWDFLGDFFINLNDYDHLKTACYLMCSCLNKEEINNWLEKNNDKVNKFLAWYEK